VEAKTLNKVIKLVKKINKDGHEYLNSGDVSVLHWEAVEAGYLINLASVGKDWKFIVSQDGLDLIGA